MIPPGVQPASTNPEGELRRASLRKVVLAETGQDIARCRGCGICNAHLQNLEMDLSVDGVIQLILQNDEEVLTSRTIWSEVVLQSIQAVCQRGLDLRAVLLALRQEALRRNINLRKAP